MSIEDYENDKEMREEEPERRCPTCKSKLVQTKRYNKCLGIEQTIWVCSSQKYPSCL
jgi:hypothetical protein